MYPFVKIVTLDQFWRTIRSKRFREMKWELETRLKRQQLSSSEVEKGWIAVKEFGETPNHQHH